MRLAGWNSFLDRPSAAGHMHDCYTLPAYIYWHCQWQALLTAMPLMQIGSGMGAQMKSVGVALTTPVGTPIEQPGVKSLRSTKTGLASINMELTRPRCTKIICTLGPSCWLEAGLSSILDAGCDIMRLNFSHGDHASHLEVCCCHGA